MLYTPQEGKEVFSVNINVSNIYKLFYLICQISKYTKTQNTGNN